MSQEIQDAMRVKQIMEDDVVKAAFARVAAKCYEDFRRADNSEKRVTAWAKANALEEVLKELQAVKDNGEIAQANVERSRKPKEI